MKSEVIGDKSYTATIEVAQSPEEVFDRISEVPEWWSKDFEGSSAKLNHLFKFMQHSECSLMACFLYIVHSQQ